MNRVPGIVRSVNKDDLFALVEVIHGDISFISCVLLSEYDLPYCHSGAAVYMLFKESDTIISLDSTYTISCRNRFQSIVTSVIFSGVMARIQADFCGIRLTSLITQTSARALGLSDGIAVSFLVKSTSLMLELRETV